MKKEKSLISLGKESNQASGIGIIQNNPCTASCHDTRAEHNKRSRKNDPNSSDSNVELKGADDGSDGNDDKCFDCFFGSSWLRYIFRRNGNIIHRKNNMIQ